MKSLAIFIAALSVGCAKQEEPKATESKATPLGFVHVDSACVGKIKPRNPKNSPLYQYQDPLDDSKWHFYVQGYVQASEAEGCWKLGLIPLDYRDSEQRAEDLPSVHEPVYRPGEEPKP